jgi:hypothetical protein
MRHARSLLVALSVALCAPLLLARPARASSDDASVAPILRLAMGPAFHIAPKAEKSTEFAFDATAGLNFATAGWDHTGLILSAEAGYAYDGFDGHAFQLVPGVGYGHPLAFVSYHPHFLIGRAGDQTFLGMRNGISMHVLGDMGSLEIAEQFVVFDGLGHHDFRMMFSVNPAAFVFAMSKL